MKDTIKGILAFFVQFTPDSVKTQFKETVEHMYWKNNLRKSDNKFYNGHFEQYFTDLVDLDRDHYRGKKMLDVGCGPLGSLEWADIAAERVGVDPLADKYIKLNGGTQSMRYVKAGAESLPFEDDSFDVVSIFNALDHVEDVSTAVQEAQRVLAPGGDLLLIVEINHKPTLTEPHFLTERIIEAFSACDVQKQMCFAVNAQHNLYRSISEGKAPAHPQDPGIICARLKKHASLS